VSHLPWLAHLYTASGAVLGLAAVMAVWRDDARTAFLLLGAAVVVDATDGVLARALRVKERLPQIDGARLDDIVDYLTYVFVPALMVVQWGLVPDGWAMAVGAAMLLSSGYGFAQAEAKVETTDHYFTGFPSYWNIVVLYIVLLRPPQPMAAAVLVGLALLVFVPLRYVYPSRTAAWRPVTLGVGAAWAALMLMLVWRLPATDGPWAMASLAYPAYYVGLSLWLHGRERRRHLRTS
jgi:phosphatidylcholine synthase